MRFLGLLKYISVFLSSFISAASSDGLAAGLQFGTAVPGLCTGWVGPPAPQLLARPCSPWRYRERLIPSKALTFRLTQTCCLDGSLKWFLQKKVKKRSGGPHCVQMQRIWDLQLFPFYSLFPVTEYLSCCFCEEFLFCSDGGGSQSSEEALQFLDRLLSTQHFLQVSLTVPGPGADLSLWHFYLATARSADTHCLSVSITPLISHRLFYLSGLFTQEGFSSTEAFLYKFLSVWDGSLLRPQILGLLSNIPVVPSSCEYCFPPPPHWLLLSLSASTVLRLSLSLSDI